MILFIDDLGFRSDGEEEEVEEQAGGHPLGSSTGFEKAEEGEEEGEEDEEDGRR